MADEISITGSMRLENGNDSMQKSFSFNADQSAVGGPSPGTLLVGTSQEAVTPSDITSQGFVYFKNLDTVNFIEVGVEVSATFYPVIKLLPGEAVAVRLSPSVALFAKADTAAARLEAQIFEA